MNNRLTKKSNFFITIAGPTAVGKTSTAIGIAQNHDCHIFSADSRQLFREMTIGTAKPTPAELAAVPHHFIDHISVTEDYSAGRYESDFVDAASSYFQNYNLGILTGGTGMYIRAALEGLDQFPDIPPSVHNHLVAIYESEGILILQRLVTEKDPVYAHQVDMDNARRLIRALEVMTVGGRPYSSYLSTGKKKIPRYPSLQICLTRDREELYERINTRVEQMMDSGLLQETEALLPYRDKKSLQTVGYKELFQYMDGDISLDEAVALIKRNSRRYAKRQMTWFRNQGDWCHIHAEDTVEIKDMIDRHLEERGLSS